MLSILPSTSWREFRGPASNQGQNFTTHQALIADQHGVERLCYVKACPPGYPMVVAESLAWLIAEALDLARPEFAALLLLPVPKLRMSMRMDQHWQHYPEVLAFCSSAVQGKPIRGRWTWLERMKRAKSFEHGDVARIAAFDHWVENQDRHSGNLLVADGRFVPIDNEYVLYSLLSAPFGILRQTLHDEAKNLLRGKALKAFEASMIVASDSHLPAFMAVQATLTQWLHVVIPNPVEAANLATAILQFLGPRAQPGWLANELGHIP